MSDITIFPARTVVTMDPSQPEVEAVAVREGKVLAAGSLDECKSWGEHVIDNRFADNLSQVVVSGGNTANRNLWRGNYWSDYQGFDEDSDRVGDSPYELYAYADRLWKDVPYAQFFKGSPVLEVLDFLERLAPFSKPDLLVRDTTPATSIEWLTLASDSVTSGVTEPQPAGKNSLDLLRESLGKQ